MARPRLPGLGTGVEGSDSRFTDARVWTNAYTEFTPYNTRLLLAFLAMSLLAHLLRDGPADLDGTVNRSAVDCGTQVPALTSPAPGHPNTPGNTANKTKAQTQNQDTNDAHLTACKIRDPDT